MTIRIGALCFSPGLAATAAAAAFIALTVWLGQWQAGRAEEKRARQALFEARMAEPPLRLTGAVPSPEPLLYRRVTASGEWIAQQQFFIDNRIRGARAGFHVITPLRLAGSGAVLLVNRGWLPRTADYPRPPAVPVPPGPAEVTGMATRPPARVLELSDQVVAGDVWQNLSIERFAERSELEVLPVAVLADVPAAGAEAVTETPDAGIAKHQEYMLTWYSLAATAFVMWVVLNLRRAKP